MENNDYKGIVITVSNVTMKYRLNVRKKSKTTIEI